MSLRARLALLYTSIVGGILLLFGTAVYVTVSVSLTSQVDNILLRSAENIISSIQVDSIDKLRVISLPQTDLSADVYIQVWGRNGRLLDHSPNISSYSRPLDPLGFDSGVPIFRIVNIAGNRVRVLTVPLAVSDRVIGYLMVARSLALVDTTLDVLLAVVLVGMVVSMIVAGVAGWFSIKQSLSPLQAVTQVALQITRADDLSRRIPYQGPLNDEVGQLIAAFNQTLSRLENLFITQRRFIADVGHELRTPLTVIKGNVDLMRRFGEVDEESLDSIVSEVDRLTRMVGDLLLLAQAESGKLPLSWKTVELDTLLLEVMQQMRVLARDKLQLRLGEIDQVIICGDRDRLKQVLVNLIGNAIKYTPRGGEVVVGMAKVENRVRLTISDNGPGIPPEDLPHIFERFYRGEKSRTRSKDGKGFGLGLSIAYWIVRNHGGQIDVSAREPQGTTFCVWLPLAQGECQEETKPTA